VTAPVTHGSLVTWVMGQELNGSLGSWVTLSDPFPALVCMYVCMSCIPTATQVYAEHSGRRPIEQLSRVYSEHYVLLKAEVRRDGFRYTGLQLTETGAHCHGCHTLPVCVNG